MPRLVFLACGLALTAACAAEETVASTQVTLSVAADEALRTRIDTLRARVFVERASGWIPVAERKLALRGVTFPLDLPILPPAADQAALLEIVVEGLEHDTVRAQTRVVTRARKNALALVSARLSLCPNPSIACDDERCHGAECKYCRSDGQCLATGLSNAEVPLAPLADDAGAVASARPEAGAVPERDGGPRRDDAATAAPNTPNTPSTPTVDASTPSAADPGGSTIMPDAGSTPASCPGANTCTPAYPCLPTSLGYTCRGRSADWPMPDGVTGALYKQKYTAQADLVLDEVTKLEWQSGLPTFFPGCTRRVEDAGTPMGERGATCTRQEAVSYCEQLSHAGHDDWRLPSAIELASLMNVSRNKGYGEAIDLSFFGDSGYQVYISSSVPVDAPTEVWMADFQSWRRQVMRAPLSDAKGYGGGRARCVRSGAPPPFASPAARYQVEAGSVTDRATRLIWQRTGSSMLMATAEVDAYCTSVGPGYRAPTPNELFTLVDFERAKPAIDSAAFPDTKIDQAYGTTADTSSELGVYFDTGNLTRLIFAEEKVYARCVRNP